MHSAFGKAFAEAVVRIKDKVCGNNEKRYEEKRMDRWRAEEVCCGPAWVQRCGSTPNALEEQNRIRQSMTDVAMTGHELGEFFRSSCISSDFHQRFDLFVGVHSETPRIKRSIASVKVRMKRNKDISFWDPFWLFIPRHAELSSTDLSTISLKLWKSKRGSAYHGN